ncbi:MAG: YceI family protein [Clostridia bacterium]|nr:YceI family protein [Deltaproteobacteria bacterium]
MFKSILAALAVSLPAVSVLAAPEAYTVDKVHSAVIWKVHHLGAGNTYGLFTDISGTLNVDPANPAASSIDVIIKADSITTHDEKRDQHLKGPDFFNTKQFPTITFKSKSVTKVDDKNATVAGDLTLHGVTKPVTAKVAYLGSGKLPNGTANIGYEATLSIKRSDFGMAYMVGATGIEDEVPLTIAIEADKR